MAKEMTGHEIHKKAEFYKEDRKKVHISLKGRRFVNGIILDIKNDFLIIDDNKLGESVVFFSEIKEGRIEPFIAEVKDGTKI